MNENKRDDSIRTDIKVLLDDLTKPKGSLGKLEDYAEKQIGRAHV